MIEYGERFCAPEDAGEYPALVDSMDEFQPVPRAGKFFAELVVRAEMTTKEGLWVPGQDKDDEQQKVMPKRARVLQLGPPLDGEPWDLHPGWEVIVAWHAGENFEWVNQAGITESLWIINAAEVLAVFKPRN